MQGSMHPVPSLTELEAEVAAYRAARFARLTAEKGWLTLIDKVWLKTGAQSLGAREGSDIIVPADRAPADLGILTLENGMVRLDASPAADLRLKGVKITSMVLRADGEGGPDEVTTGSLTLSLVRREDDVALRIRDSEAPARRSFLGIPAYPVDPAWRVLARLESSGAEKEVIYEDGDGRPQPYRSPGALVFEKDGQTLRLEPVFESDRKRLFLLFADPTNRDQTYGAGRFLYASLPEAGHVVLDFNKAYNPPCAFTPHVACPLPPFENRLRVRVEAGEKRPS